MLHLICLLSLHYINCLSFFISFSLSLLLTLFVSKENGPYISQTTSKEMEAVYPLTMLRFAVGANLGANRLIIKVTPG